MSTPDSVQHDHQAQARPKFAEKPGGTIITCCAGSALILRVHAELHCLCVIAAQAHVGSWDK
jgi:hypothetical protein